MISKSRADNPIRSTKLYELFKYYKNKKFVFVEPGGNFGDHIIYQGAYKLAELAGLDYVKVSHDVFMQNSYDGMVIYIHGGGGFVPWWTGTPAIELSKAADQSVEAVVLGPQTFLDDCQYLEEKISKSLKRKRCKVYLFAREMTSFQLLEQYVKGADEILHDNDTALNLNKIDILSEDVVKRYDAYFIRNDKESACEQPYGFTGLWGDPVAIASTFDSWVKLHAFSRQIFTNRLHSSIVGSILGIPTTLMPNSYHKNRSVWEYSLKDRGVTWGDDLTLTKTQQFCMQNRITRKIIKSEKYKKLLIKYIYKI